MLSAILRRAGVLPPVVRQFLAYGVIGTFTTLTDAALFALLVTVGGWTSGMMPAAASILSYSIAASIAYVLNSRIAFRDRYRGDTPGTMVRFAVTFGSSAVLAGGIVAAGHALLGDASAALLGSKVASIVVIICWNFMFLRYWVFRATGERGGSDV